MTATEISPNSNGVDPSETEEQIVTTDIANDNSNNDDVTYAIVLFSDEKFPDTKVISQKRLCKHHWRHNVMTRLPSLVFLNIIQTHFDSI